MQFDMDLLQRCWFLTGPTASGKTAVGVELAVLLNAEILALDSMTIYRGMDIGTAKPDAETRRRVPHHLLDLFDPHQECSVADYVALAEVACREIVARGRTPLFVGGTGLYLRALLRGLFEGPAADWSIRHRLQAEPGPQLHARLQAVDPASAARLHPNDQRRLIRALEVFELTGKPLSAQQQQSPLPTDQRPRHVYWLHLDREALHQRIDSRVEQMISDGLVDEVRRLLSGGQPLGRTARQGLGYKEIIEHLAGQCSQSEAVATIQTRTRQFAKRQETWFRNLEECQAVEIGAGESAAAIAGRLRGE